jgi:hypothetical protein
VSSSELPRVSDGRDAVGIKFGTSADARSRGVS